MKTLILGMGNPILSDDGIGPRLVKELKALISNPDIAIEETSLAGMNLMEELVGFERAIIIDAILSGGAPGAIRVLKPHDFTVPDKDPYSQHNMGLLHALELGKALGQPMPREVTIIAIEARDVTTFGEELSSEVEKAIPTALQCILQELGKGE